MPKQEHGLMWVIDFRCCANKQHWHGTRSATENYKTISNDTHGNGIEWDFDGLGDSSDKFDYAKGTEIDEISEISLKRKLGATRVR